MSSEPRSPDLPPFPHHTIGEELGRGGMGTVLEAFDPSLKRSVAMKVLHTELRPDPDVTERFIAEARLAGRLAHPHILTSYALGRHPQHGVCFTMRKVSGQTLFQRTRTHRRTPKGAELDELVDILVAICDALAHAHESGVVHGDLKSHNILLGDHGAVYLMDWGNARTVASPAPTDRNGRPLILGTLGMLAPEQARAQPVDPRTDIFGLGALLYTLLARRLPYSRGGPEARIDAAKVGRRRPLSELAPKAPGSLRDIAERAMAFAPDDRFQTARDLRQALVDYRRRRVDAPTRRLVPGEVLMREGDPSDILYIVDEGTFVVTRDGCDTSIAEVGPGAVLGETGLLTDNTRTATVTASTRASVRCLDRARVNEELDRLAPWIKELVTSLAGRVRKATYPPV